MTPQEQQLLESLASRIASTPISQKDPDADALIRQKIGAVPDALYILTQTVLIQEMALNQANNRLHDLQQQIDTHRGEQNAQPTSFLGRLFGTGAPSHPPVAAPPYIAPPPAYAPQYDPPPYQQAPSPTSSFLRSAATTATGVAAGALAFEGIEALFGHHGGYGGSFGGNSFGNGEFLGGGRPEETVINNYYEEPRGDSGGDRFNDASNVNFLQDSSDASSRSDTFDDSSDGSDTSGDDFSSTDV